MARYRITEKSFIDNRIVEAGEEIESNEKPAAHWEPLDKPAKVASKSASAEDAEVAEAARIAAEALAAEEAGRGMIQGTPQELARIDAEVEAARVAAVEAAAVAAAEAAAADAEHPLV